MTVNDYAHTMRATPTNEQAADHIARMINAGAVSVMMSIGHRTGLFDVMARLSASTSQQIADAAELSERYVREWLAVMVTGGIVDYIPGARTYQLPAGYAANLTRNGSDGNLAVYAQTIPLMGSIQDRLLTCFETGEGTRYDEYPCFHQFMAEDSRQTVVGPLFDCILPLGGDLLDRLEAGIDVLDAGCGRGEALVAMAERFPASRFTGYDLCPDAIASATSAAQRKELENIRFETRDLTGFEEDQAYDFITSFDAVHDQKDPDQLLANLHRALRTDGIYLMQDIGGSAILENNLEFPMAPLLYAISCSHCMPVSLGQGGKGLGTMWGWETAESMLRNAGFERTERHVLEHDPMNVWFVSRKSQHRD
jgi:2-polyprenyl-3-methyl-5-hydroxy-6-metoxy-1,4-benzoquinol methylase